MRSLSNSTVSYTSTHLTCSGVKHAYALERSRVDDANLEGTLRYYRVRSLMEEPAMMTLMSEAAIFRNGCMHISALSHLL